MEYPRITNGYMNETVISNLVSNRSILMDLQTKISSGKRIEKPSDDIFASISVLNANSSLSKINNFFKNINTAKSELETADKAVQTTIDVVHKARELTIQALNGTTGTEQLNLISTQIDQLIEQVKDTANTKYANKYIFGGKVTNTAPFTVPAAGEIRYIGSASGSHQRNIEISEGVTINVNLSGDALFGYYYDDPPGTLNEQGLLSTLIQLKDEMELANPDKDVIRDRLGDLETDMTTLLDSLSTIGGLLTRLDVTQRIHEDDEISLTQIKSEAEDIDFAKTISDLKFQESALQASLQVSARVIQASILRYI